MTIPSTVLLVDEAEQALLGALLLDSRSAWPDVSAIVTEQDFSSKEHRVIFGAIATACRAGQWPDAVTVATALELAGHAKETGGLAYLAELARYTPGTVNAAAYATLVRARGQRAALAATLRQQLEQLEKHGAPAADVAEALGERLTAIMERLTSGEDQRIGDALVDALLDFEERADRRDAGGIVGVTTGLRRLDAMTGGLQPGYLYVLAGLTSSGKTAASLSITAAAARAGHAVGIVSREMPSRELAARLCSAVHGVKLRALFAGHRQAINEVNEANIIDPIQLLPIHLDDKSCRLEEVAARITTWHRKHGIRLAVVDYLQLVTADGDTRALEVAAVSRRLKQLAMQLGIAVLALSQFNRGASHAGALGDRPELHHLKESGSVEQDADAVFVLWRTTAQRNADAVDRPRELMLSLLKNRQGPIGDVYGDNRPLIFEVATQRFLEQVPLPDDPQAHRPNRGRNATSFADRSAVAERDA